MSNTKQKEQNVQTAGESGDRAGIRTLDLLIKRDATNSQNQDACVTRSQNVHDRKPQVTGQSNTRPYQYGTWHGYEKTMLYLFECEGFYKIGISMDPVRRLSGIQGANPFPVKKIKSRTIYRTVGIISERRAHEVIADHRVSGEWFNCTLEQAEHAFNEGLKYASRAWNHIWRD